MNLLKQSPRQEAIELLAIYIALRLTVSRADAPYDCIVNDTQLVEFIDMALVSHVAFQSVDQSEESERLD